MKKFEKNIKREIEIEERISSGTADIIDYFELGDIYLSSGKYNELLYLICMKLDSEVKRK